MAAPEVSPGGWRPLGFGSVAKLDTDAFDAGQFLHQERRAPLDQAVRSFCLDVLRGSTSS